MPPRMKNYTVTKLKDPWRTGKNGPKKVKAATPHAACNKAFRYPAGGHWDECKKGDRDVLFKAVCEDGTTTYFKWGDNG